MELSREILFLKKEDTNQPPSSNKDEGSTEHIFVDFNAWEFSATDELWAGLIRNIYSKVEQRMEWQRTKSPSWDGKRHWRVKRAMCALKSSYGGLSGLRLHLGVCIICAMVAFWLFQYIMNSLFMKTEQLSFILTLFGVLSAPAVSLYSLVTDINSSRGQVIFDEAKSIRDTIGFMSKVRSELSELFDFINTDFREQTAIQLRLVLFIDDLDRCLGGGNVKMLEAIQLLINVPGAPVIVFLSIDSRVVIASLEQYLNKSMDINDAMITGWEYLEKFVQLPFFLPQVSEHRVDRFIRATVRQSDMDSESVRQLIVQFQKCCEKNEKKMPQGPRLGFAVWCKFQRQGRLTQSSGEFLYLPFSVLDGKLKELSSESVSTLLKGVALLVECPMHPDLEDHDLEGWDTLRHQLFKIFRNAEVVYGRKVADEPSSSSPAEEMSVVSPRRNPANNNYLTPSVHTSPVRYADNEGKVFEAEQIFSIEYFKDFLENDEEGNSIRINLMKFSLLSFHTFY